MLNNPQLIADNLQSIDKKNLQFIDDIIRCPITHGIFNEPVFAEDGNIYERESISTWFKTHAISPLTRLPITNVKLMNCRIMKNLVEEYLKIFPEKQNEQYVIFHNFNFDAFTASSNKIKYLKSSNKIYSITSHAINKILQYDDEIIKEFINIIDKSVFCSDNILHKICSAKMKVSLKIYECIFDKYKKCFECVDEIKYKPIHYLCEDQFKDNVNFDVLNFFCKRVDLNSQNNKLNTPLHILCSHDIVNDIAIETLLKYGAKPNIINKLLKSPLHYLCYDGDKSIKAIQLLIDNGADILLKDKNEETVFHYLCNCDEKSDDSFKYILDVTKSINHANSISKTKHRPLYLACINKKYNIINMLLQKNIQLNVESDNITEIHYASKYCDIDIIKLFIKHGSNLKSKTKNDWSALHYACKYNNVDVIKFLINNGLNINDKTLNGTTCTDLISKNQNIIKNIANDYLKILQTI